MSARSPSALLQLAQQQMGRGHVDGAIDSLTQALGMDVDNAAAHALLAVCLIDRKRLTAAEHEARAALALAPDDWFVHLAMGQVRFAQRKPADAEEHFKQAVALAPQHDTPVRELGRFYLAQDRAAQAREFIDAACALAPGNPDNQSLLARWHLDQGDFARAEAIAREVLGDAPDDREALLVLGWAVLRGNRVDEAYQHAVWAVRNAPNDVGTLRLLCAVKARQSVVLGTWFRFSAFLGSGSGKRTVLMLVGMYLAVRLLSLVLGDAGYPAAAAAVNYAWLGFCVYSWVAPTLFQRMLNKELDQVKLRPDF
jgi:Tfp pilus assembly protein PilF